VLERHPEGVMGLPGHVWPDMPGKVRSVGEHELEFTDEPPMSAVRGGPHCECRSRWFNFRSVPLPWHTVGGVSNAKALSLLRFGHR
jgi:hypothetical protein